MLKILIEIAVMILLIFILLFAFRLTPKDPCPRCQSKNRTKKFFFGKEEAEENQEIGGPPLGDYGEREICADCGYIFRATDK